MSAFTKILLALSLALLVPVTSQAATPDLRQMGRDYAGDLKDFERLNPDVKVNGRCALGVSTTGENLDIVTAVGESGSALEVGDRILSVNGLTKETLPVRLSSISPDEVVKLEIKRGGEVLAAEAQCMDFGEIWLARGALVKALKGNEAEQCIDAARKLFGLEGMTSWNHYAYEKCNFRQGWRDQAWLNKEWPQLAYKTMTIEMQEWHVAALHGGTCWTTYWPTVEEWIAGFDDRGYTDYAKNLRRQYDKRGKELEAKTFTLVSMRD